MQSTIEALLQSDRVCDWHNSLGGFHFHPEPHNYHCAAREPHPQSFRLLVTGCSLFAPAFRGSPLQFSPSESVRTPIRSALHIMRQFDLMVFSPKKRLPNSSDLLRQAIASDLVPSCYNSLGPEAPESTGLQTSCTYCRMPFCSS